MNADLQTLSLCAGIGGLDLGFKRAFPNARTVCYVENEIPAVAILAANIARGRLDAAPIWSDLKTFDAGPWRGRIDAILGGYPCQPFSVAGKRGGANDPRHLWPYIREIIRIIQPRICVFENVRGHARLGLSGVLGDLRGLGYRVRAGIYSAAEVGAPHRRERVFILAHIGDARPSCPGIESQSGEQERQPGREQNHKTGPEPREDARTLSRGRRANVLADSDGARLQGYSRNGNGSNEPGRLATIEKRSACSRGLLDDSDCNGYRGRKQWEKRNQIQRQRLRGHAGFSCQTCWPSRPKEPQHEWEELRTVDRKLNPRWVAQLMGFPSDWCEVEGLTREMKLRGLGNAVVPQQADLAIRSLIDQS